MRRICATRPWALTTPPSPTAPQRSRAATTSCSPSRRGSTRPSSELKTALTETRGEGEAESGAVKVTVDAQNRVVDIELTPKALRLGSTDRLRTALLDACDAAVADVASKMREVAGVDDDGDPMEAFFEGLPEIKALMPLSLRAPRKAARPDPAEPEENDG